MVEMPVALLCCLIITLCRSVDLDDSDMISAVPVICEVFVDREDREGCLQYPRGEKDQFQKVQFQKTTIR